MNKPELVTIDGASARIYRRAPDLNGLKALAIGGIRFSSLEAGCALLAQVIATARAEGYQALLGPLDGDTWHSYRLVTESDGSAPFLMEPVSGSHDLAVFEKAGFKPVSNYLSSMAKLEETLGERPATVAGVTVSAWDGKDGEKLIRHLFDMSIGAFARNRFFTPIDFSAFLDIYKPIMPFIDPKHVLFARDQNGDLKGFLFGTPDHFAKDGKPAAILKTYASTMRGVGHLLADTYHRRALDLGFEKVIHALIHENNASRQRSEMHGARVFRRYALMGLTLASV
jgi:hypothetical protein